MTGYTNLFRRGATYYFRARVPNAIVDSYGKEEEKFSLKTKDYREAIQRVRKESANVEAKFANHRQLLEDRSKPLSTIMLTEHLEHLKRSLVWSKLKLHEDFKTHGMPDPKSDAVIPFRELYANFAEKVQENLPLNRIAYASGDYSSFLEMAVWWISHHYGRTVEKSSPEAQKVAVIIQEANLEILEALSQRNSGVIYDTPELSQPAFSHTPATIAVDVPLLSKVVEEWVSDQNWVVKTEDAYRAALQAFIAVCGDKPFTDYPKADARNFKNVLSNLPTNWKHRKEFKGMTMQEASASASSLGLKPMSPANAKKILQFVSSLWKWIKCNYDELEYNIFDGVVIKVEQSGESKRYPFNTDELNSIFNSPIYTGCQSYGRWKDKGDYSMKATAKYWAPLISLYTGSRMEEVLQLYTSDIKEKDGIYYFDINKEDEKQLKNNQSIRNIPIHKTLIDAGFLSLVASRQATGEKRLFPELKKCPKGKYSTTYSKYFANLLKSVGVKHDKNCFHSFRHTFEDACREADIRKEVMDALQGHKEQGSSSGYGKGYNIPKLNENMQRVSYCDLELTYGSVEV